MLLLRSVLIHLALIAPTAVVVGQQQFPPPITEDCDPCLLVEDGAALSDACQDLNPIVAQIVAKDSACARDWDAFCLLKYNDCYNQACGPQRQGLIALLAQTGGPQDRPLNRTQIARNCPDTLVPSSTPTPAPSSSPSSRPSLRPSQQPSDGPSLDPSSAPSVAPSSSPSEAPSASPSAAPSAAPSVSPSSRPSFQPSDGPSLDPSSSPSEAPTVAPTATPTASPSTPFPTVDPECQGRPWVITFLYNGGNCAQSDNLQPRQKFSCIDFTSRGPPTHKGEESYITAVPRGSRSGFIFFAGTVPVGEKFTLNADRVYDKLASEMTLTVYEEEGGDVVQVVDLHLSCSQPLILYDKFGASEVTQWVETSGRVVSLRHSGVVTGVYEEDLGVLSDSF
mmetsp:Transcript_16587/g.18653  ORF Transcript_16587/g.18653 Transcript_16587/m.18653 type:complete len:394 (+) Transcript_16587:52-1233(+)